MTRQTLLDGLQTILWGFGLVAVLSVNFLFYGSLTVCGICLGVALLIIGGWLAVRGVRQGAALPRTGMEIPLLAMLVGALLSQMLSPNPRSGLERMAWFVVLSVTFYFLIDSAVAPSFRELQRGALVVVTWPVALSSLLSLYVQYNGWWGQVGSTQIMPPFPFRYATIIGHANIYMGLANLVAPVALVMFLSTRSRIYRVIAALWLVTYAASVPFSSSRGGWLGMAVWILVLGGLWLVDSGRWTRLIKWLRSHWPVAAALGVVAIAGLGAAALKFYATFAGANPTHGSGLSLNRESIWGPAIQWWQSSPWIGSGLGQLSARYYGNIPAFPTNWFAFHAHSVPLQILAEMGLLGFIPFLALTVAGGVLMVRCYRKTPAGERLWSAASIAALAGLLVHGIFEEFSSQPMIITIVMLHIALVAGAAGPLPRIKHVRITWLSAPALLALGVAVYSLWSYAPLYAAAPAGEEVTDWKQAAQSASLSANRDPRVAFYQNQAGIAWAMDWQASGDPQSLAQARNYTARGVKLTPENAIYWANLAVLDWQSGQSAVALNDIRQAILLSPNEPSFPLNYGWFLEQSGRPTEAEAQYRRVLELDPSSASLPFWQSSPARKAAVAGVNHPGSAAQSYWQTARQDITVRQFAAARMALALGSVYEEPALALDTGWASLYLAQGNIQEFSDKVAAIEGDLDYNYWGLSRLYDAYNYYYTRNFQRVVVPGYLRLSADYGQLDLLAQQVQIQTAAGDCASAARAWATLQREQNAGALTQGGYPPPPTCVESAHEGG